MRIREKILCLVDNTSIDAWGHKLTKKFAEENNSIFRGLINNKNQNIETGCYHSNPFSMPAKDIIYIAKNFDRIVVLDQFQEQYSSPHLFVSMFKLIKNLEEIKIKVEIINKKNFFYIEYWHELLTKNKSFCIYPWIYSGGYYGYHTTCMLSKLPLTKINEITNWKKDKKFSEIRDKMLKGELIEKNCNTCYKHEEKDIPWIRYHETLEWVIRMRYKSIKDLEKISAPLYYEIRSSNKCNIKCRTCEPSFSHLIEKEYNDSKDKQFKNLAIAKRWSEMTTFDTINFDHIKRLYVAGGEPTILPEFYKFLNKCIYMKKTDFDFRINTNAVKINDKLFQLFKNFKNLGFSCSIDGTSRVNEYIRWGTNSEKQIENIHQLHAQGHQISFISVCSIYNINDIGKLYQFYEKEFPYATVQLQLAGYKDDLLSPFNYPNHKLALDSLSMAKKTSVYYHNERGTKAIVDTLIKHYQKKPSCDLNKLKKFFIYNDKLDEYRGSRLEDYIADLDNCRKYIVNT